MPPGRPPRHGTRHIYHLKLYLWEGEDDDLIAFLEAIPPRRRAAALKTALRSGNGLNLFEPLQDARIEPDNDSLDLEAFLFD